MGTEEIGKITIDTYRNTKSFAMTGLVLRDIHGVLSFKTEMGVSIKKYIENSGSFPYVLSDSIVRGITNYLRIKEHIKVNSRDTHNKRILSLRINKLFRDINYELKTNSYLKSVSPSESNLEIILNKYLAF
jgi:ribosomal protein S15P/S13E